MRLLLSLVLVAALSATASAVTIDGTKDASYGAAVSVQTVQTQFGDNFSEWNAAYATIEGGKLNLMLTGNLEANFNKLEIFIDSQAGVGQTTFTSAGNDGASTIDGLVFDTPFTANYHLIARRGHDGGANLDKFDLDFADLALATSSSYQDLFLDALEGSATTGTGVNGNPIGVAYDNSNSAGIGGGTAALSPAETAAALAVTTGLELSIDLADLGYVTGGHINVMIGQNSGNHGFWSNQFLGGLTGPQANIGGANPVDFTTFAGDQFFAIWPVPEPTSALLAGLALVGLAVRRRV